MSGPYTIQIRMKTKIITPRDNKVIPNTQEPSKIPSDHQPQEAEEEEGILEEDSTLNQGKLTAFSMERIRGIKQEPAKSQSRNRRKLPKLKHDRIRQSRSSTPPHTIPHTF
jgi:long-subunit acyl-CoA synthetase (AMP-forming)